MSPGSLRRLAKRCLGAFPGDRLRLGQCHTAFILSIYATQTHAFSRVVLSLTASVFAQSDKTDDFINAEMKRQREFPAFLSPSSRTVTSSRRPATAWQIFSQKTSVKPETVFKIASVSKQFIATGVLLRVESNVVSPNRQPASWKTPSKTV